MKRFLLLVAAITLIFLTLRIFVFGVVYVQSNSMQPLIHKNDGLLVNRLAFGLHLPWGSSPLLSWNSPKRGDIVVFQNPHDNYNLWLKRVIGLPGDTLRFHDHKLLLNGKIISGFNKDNHETITSDDAVSRKYRVWSSYLEEDWGPVTVPAGEIFVMGDHRGASIDSREWGSIPEENLRGRAALRFWPIDIIMLFKEDS